METTEAERSKRLHNFSLPYLKWGNQRFLRCVKLDDHRQQSIPTNSRSNPNIEPTNRVSLLEEKGEDDSQSERPWNLRTRRAACKCNAPLDRERKVVESPRRNERLSLVVVKGNRVRGHNLEVQERVKFSVSLSKEEIGEDFKEMVGIRPPRRPKKRPRIVQKQLDSLFPGLWLTEVTKDSYKVPDVAE